MMIELVGGGAGVTRGIVDWLLDESSQSFCPTMDLQKFNEKIRTT